jgi:non-specific serine/threonine protein kinase
LFGRLSVFAGGFDLGAAEAVVLGDPIERDDVLPVLSRLINKSLVAAEPTRPHTTRYRMLDTIREYALEKLQLGGEAQWRQRHADYFIGWTVEATKLLGSQEQVSWLRRIDEEQPNIRVALEWTLTEQPDGALRLAAAMGSYWWMGRHFAEGLESLTRALELETSNPQARAAALAARARLSRRRGDYVTAKEDARECAEIARQARLHHELSRALTMLGIVAANEGDLHAAAPFFREARQVAEEVGDVERVASSLNNMAMIESSLGQHAEAMAHAERALTKAELVGDRWLRAQMLDTSGRIQLRLRNFDDAIRRYAEAIRISAEFQDTVNIADCIEGMALIADAHGDLPRALTLLSAVDSIRALSGAVSVPEWIGEARETQARVTAKLTRNVFEEARRRGAGMTTDEAIRFALGTAETDRRDGATRLTGREIQVARLIAEGLTNGEVAGRLRIADRTVDAHVEHIRNKLGLRSRTQIAVWAKERLGTD